MYRIIFHNVASSRYRRAPEIWEVTKTGVVGDLGKIWKKKMDGQKKKYVYIYIIPGFEKQYGSFERCDA